jgi:hypothetical protein
MEEQPIKLTFEFTNVESRRVIWQLSTRAKRAIVGWVGVILVGIVLYGVLNRLNHPTSTPSSQQLPSALPPSSDFLTDFVIPLLPWLIVLLFICFFIPWAVHRRAVTQIAGKQRAYVFRSEGVTVDVLYTRTESQWAIFQKVIETKQFFILKTGPSAGHVIPKRVFRDSDELDRFRNMVREHIDVPTARNAFPVEIKVPPPK